MSEGSNPITDRIKDHYQFEKPFMIQAQYNCFIELPAIRNIIGEADAQRKFTEGEFRLKMRLYKSDPKTFDDEFELLVKDIYFNTRVQNLEKIMKEKLGIPIYRGQHRKGILVEFKDQDGTKLQVTRTFAHYNIFPNTTLHLRPAAFGESLSTGSVSEDEDSRVRQEVGHKRQRNEYTTAVPKTRKTGRKSHIRESDDEEEGQEEAGYCHCSQAVDASSAIGDGKSTPPARKRDDDVLKPASPDY